MKILKSYLIFIIILLSLLFIYNVNASTCPSGSESTLPIEYKLLIVGDSINNEMPIVGYLNGTACLVISKNGNDVIENYYYQQEVSTTLKISTLLDVEFSGQAVYNDDRYSVLSYKFPSAVITQNSNSGLITLTITNGKVWLKLPNNVNR